MKYCAEPHCPRLVHRGRCTVHRREQGRLQQQRRGTSHARGYDARWARYSKARLQRLPICGQREDGTFDATHSRCARDGRFMPAQCTDHVIPISQDGSMWDPQNHLSLCLSCNTWKHNTIERTAKGQPQ
jgi:5-methylcytosine-specific restriction endonuclease McrA